MSIDIHPPPGRTRAANFTGFASLVRSFGGDPARILEANAVDPVVMADPDYHVDNRAMAATLEYCSERLNAPLFGLLLADAQDADVWGMLTALARSAPDIETAIRNFTDYVSIVHSGDTGLSFVKGSRVAELRWSPRIDVGRNEQANYQAVLLIAKMLGVMGLSPAQLSYIAISSTLPGRYRDELAGKLRAETRLGADINAIGFSTELLGRKIGTANRALFELISSHLREARTQRQRGIVHDVRHFVRAAIWQGGCSLSRCAASLGLAARTLQFQLAREETSFSELVQQERTAAAKKYLMRGDASLSEVALSLGYAEQTSFGRAFKKRTGSTPKRYRA